MVSYTEKDLRTAERVIRAWRGDETANLDEVVATAMAAERRRSLQALVRELRKHVKTLEESGVFSDENGMSMPYEPGAFSGGFRYVISRCLKRIRGGKGDG